MSATKYHHHHTIEAAMRGQPKERPILFSTEMVQRIIDGRKTQTRRIIKPQPVLFPTGWQYGKGYKNSCSASASPATDILFIYGCPYGRRADRLWVRETWNQIFNGITDEYIYAATDNDVFSETKWRPSIHMPRAACRLLLEITDVRVEQLQDINRADAIAEGLHFTISNGGPNIYYDNYHTGRWLDPEMLNNPIGSFRTLWEKINGPGSWDANPWVWVISFKKIEK